MADEFIFLVYDDRYRAAGLFLTVMLVGTWFGIAATMADATMMGIGKPSNVALSNGVKLAVIVAALPWVLTNFGMNAAIVVFVLAEAIRYVVLVLRQRSLGLSFIRHDVLMLAFFIGLILLFREATALLGLTDGLAGWQAQALISHI